MITTEVPDILRKRAVSRDSWACAACGRSIIGRPYVLLRRQRGGDASLFNLLTACGTERSGCAGSIIYSTDPEVWEKGYRVRSGQEPALVPVLYFSEHGREITAWLTADGLRSFVPPEGAV